MNRPVKPYHLKRPVSDKQTLSLDYAKELNPQQYAAVTAPDGPALIIAGAGSGKTRTLVYRVAYLIDSGIDPEAILLLTFTRKAAQEMLQRAGLLIGTQCERVSGGTFHSVANLLLRRYGRSVGLDPNFTILDRTDAEDLVSLIRTNQGLHEKGRRFPRKGTILSVFSKSVNTLQTLDDIVLQEYPQFSDHLEDLKSLFVAYVDMKVKRQLVDYDDLLVKLLHLLSNDEEIRHRISSLYRYLLVDEYQDTNRLQAELVRHIAITHNHVMVVGDDSQSIYRFRGANFRNIMDFPDMFPGTTIYKLEENYRSTQPVLALANSLIEGASERYSKKLFTQQSTGPLPALVEGETENAQSRFVAQKILELREEGIPLHEMAVLFRSSFHSFDLEIELARRDLPFIKRGGFKFVETAHVKDVVAHLRVLENPLDAVSWNRLLLLVEGVGPKKSQDLIGKLLREPHPFGLLRRADGRTGGALRELGSILEQAAEAPSPADQVREITEHYLPILKEQYDDYPKRIRDVEHLSSIAERYEGLDEFLADLALEPPDPQTVDSGDRDDERLVLSTIHSAKGLEWQCVFVIWLVDGRFPSVYAFSADEDLEEERRLLYVAATRAKRHLFLTYPINIYDKATGSVFSKPTRFLDCVPDHCLESWAAIDEGASSSFGYGPDEYT